MSILKIDLDKRTVYMKTYLVKSACASSINLFLGCINAYAS